MSETPQGEGRLGIIAGAGVLPRLVAEAELRAGRAPYVLGLRGSVGDWVDDWPHRRIGLGQVGAVFRQLAKEGCARVCFAGGVARPNLFALRVDLGAISAAPRLLPLMRRGDDGLLRGLARLFEERGYAVVAAHALVSDLLAPAGPLTARRPSERDLRDVARAAEIATALGAGDVGQGAVVAQLRCLAVEAVAGTDAMLDGLVGDHRRGGAAIPSGVLYKAPKPGQDRRVDLPAIGPGTMRRAKAAGLNGVAVEAGGVMLLDPAATIAAAEAEGLFLFGRQAGDAA